MLIYNLDRIFRARGIEKPFSYLSKLGFADSHAHVLSKGKTKAMKITTLDKLCKALYCTPDELMEWVPEKGQVLSADHPLNKLKREKMVPDIYSKLQSVPMEKLEKIQKFIEKETETED